MIVFLCCSVLMQFWKDGFKANDMFELAGVVKKLSFDLQTNKGRNDLD